MIVSYFDCKECDNFWFIEDEEDVDLAVCPQCNCEVARGDWEEVSEDWEGKGTE